MTVTEYPTGARVRTSSSASFLFVCCFFFVIVLFRVVVECCVARIYSLGDGKAFGEKIIILRIKTFIIAFYIALFLSFFLSDDDY